MGAADEHRDRPAAGAHVELERDEIADVDPVVLDDLAADLAAAEELRPQLVRVLAARVVRGELGGIVDHGEIGPAVRAAPGRPDPLGLEEAAHVLADAAVGRRVQRADGLARVREDLPRGRLDRRGRPRALERASAVALIRGVVANVPGPVARRRLAPGGVRPRRDRLRAQRLDPPVVRHLAGERAAHVVVGRDVVHDAKVALIAHLDLQVPPVREALLVDGDRIPPLLRQQRHGVFADIDLTAGPAVRRDERRAVRREAHGLVRRRVEVRDRGIRVVHQAHATRRLHARDVPDRARDAGGGRRREEHAERERDRLPRELRAGEILGDDLFPHQANAGGALGPALRAPLREPDPVPPALPVERDPTLHDDRVFLHRHGDAREPGGPFLHHVPSQRVGAFALRRAHVDGEADLFARRDVVGQRGPHAVPHDGVRAHVEPVVAEVDGMVAARGPGAKAGVLDAHLDVDLAAGDDRRRCGGRAVRRVEVRRHPQREGALRCAERRKPGPTVTDEIGLDRVRARPCGKRDAQREGAVVSG